jgi:hypothetical protein
MKLGKQSNKPRLIDKKLDNKFQDLIIRLKRYGGKFVREGMRLSERHHRGRQCKTCKLPEANNSAHTELINDGDGPDLCWGYCNYEND